jgi:NAD(P)-dependent dehydrogenase (short-subunit alcohol dehydrogenase family)
MLSAISAPVAPARRTRGASGVVLRLGQVRANSGAGASPETRMIRPTTDPVAIVTGASSQIGREVIRRLVSLGYAIVAVYLEDQRRADALVAELQAAGGTAVAVRADLADDLDVERVFTEAIAAFASVDVLVHTAVRGVSVLYRHAARHLGRGAAIVTVSTAEPITPSLAQRLRELDITVNGVPAGREPLRGDHDVAELIALLERWRQQPDS